MHDTDNAATSIPAVDNDTKAFGACLMTYHDNSNLRQHSVSSQVQYNNYILPSPGVFHIIAYNQDQHARALLISTLGMSIS